VNEMSLEAVHAALLDAFPTRDELERLVQFQLHKSLATIVSPANLSQQVFELVRWAKANGRLDELVRAARSANPGNPRLGELGSTFGDANEDAFVRRQDRTVRASASSVVHAREVRAEPTRRVNPYEWRGNGDDTRTVPRDELLNRILDQLKTGNVEVIGGLGTGKTMLLMALQKRLMAEGQTLAVLWRRAPSASMLTLGEVFRAVVAEIEPDDARLGEVLAVHVRGAERGRPLDDLSEKALLRLSSKGSQIIEAILDGRGVERAVLLFDEIEGYIDHQDRSNLAREFFNLLERWTRDLGGRLRIVAAGGLDLYGLKTLLGSAFEENVKRCELQPLTAAQVIALVEPFRDDGRPLSAAALEQLRISAGGHAALTIYGLQRGWELGGEVTSLVLARIFAEFQREAHFVGRYWEKIANPVWSDAARRVLAVIQDPKGPLSVGMLQDAIRESHGTTELSVDQVLQLLVAAGLIRDTALRGAGEPEVHVELIPSVLLPRGPALPSGGDFRAVLVSEVSFALGFIQRFASDFFWGDRDARLIVPEETLTASVALQLLQRGASVERGRDLTVSLPRFAATTTGAVFVRVWGYEGFEEALALACAAWGPTCAAGVVATFADRPSDDWLAEYERRCVQGRCERYEHLGAPSPAQARIAAHSTRPDGRVVVVDHLLISLREHP